MPRKLNLALVLCAAGALMACSDQPSPAQGLPDDVLEARVESALESASDLPTTAISVEVSEGIVTLTGSVACEECGGRRTPAGSATVQQSLGAVVRAVPGVERVEFDLQYQL